MLPLSRRGSAQRYPIGLAITVIALAIAGRRLYYLFRLVTPGKPAPDRLGNWGKRAEAELTEVGGQRKLLKWTVPGLAHAFTFWGFTVLLLTIIEAYGDLFEQTFAIPGIGHSRVRRLRRGLLRLRRAARARRLRRHPHHAVAGAPRAALPLLRLAHDGAPGSRSA